MLCQQQEELKQQLFHFTVFINKRVLTPWIQGQMMRQKNKTTNMNNENINKIKTDKL